MTTLPALLLLYLAAGALAAAYTLWRMARSGDLPRPRRNYRVTLAEYAVLLAALVLGWPVFAWLAWRDRGR